MRIITFMLWCISSGLFAQLQGNSETIHEVTKAKFPISSGLVVYEISGDGTGTSKLYFDRNGWRCLEDRKMEFKRYGITSEENVIEFTDGDFFYKANMDAGKGKMLQDKSWSGLLKYKSNAEAIDAIMTSKGAKLLGNQDLLEKPCQVWVFESGAISEIWEWKGIPLKIKKKLPGLNYEMTATSITETSTLVPEQLILVLEGIEWTR